LNRAKKVVWVLKRHYGADTFRIETEDPFHALIGCILSQRTKDKNAAKAARNLFTAASTPQSILNLPEERLKQLIRPSGYYNQKARYIIEATRIIVEKFDGETPRMREELMSLPGVGSKTADIVLSHGYGKPAVAVDTHIHRVSVRMGLTSIDAKTTEVKQALEDALPQTDWSYADGALLQLGKDYCRAHNPKCGECPVETLCGYEEKRV
jgi:endonuclease-3